MKFIETLSKRNGDCAAHAPLCAVFLGDSVTHGCFEIREAPGGGIAPVFDHEAVYHAAWRRTLCALYSNAPVAVVNAGLNGTCAPEGLKRLERDALRFSPDLAVVCFGLNDVNGRAEGLEAYGAALEGIFAALAARDVETVFMTPNMLNTYVSPLTSPGWVKEYAAVTAEYQNGGLMDAYMHRAREAARAYGVPVCDCYAKWKKLHAAGVDTTALLCNHVNHPSREMHGLFAQSLLDLLFDNFA